MSQSTPPNAKTWLAVVALMSAAEAAAILETLEVEDSYPDVLDTAIIIQEEKDKVSKEITAIRKRRTNTDGGKRFPKGIEDYTLITGIAYAAIYFGALFAMSTGVMGDSTGWDHWMSTTVFDIGDECQDNSGSMWMNIWIDNDELTVRAQAYNVDDGDPHLNWTLVNSESINSELV